MLVDASQSCGGLSSKELRHLREWLISATAIGIDAIEDLTSRPWPSPVWGTVIGAFATGSEAAGWLLVAKEGLWVVVTCSTGEVSPALNSLAEALAVIHPGQHATHPAPPGKP